MDQILGTVVLVLVLIVIYRAATRQPRRKMIPVDEVVTCHLPPEEQGKRAAARNLVFQSIEESARSRGEIGPELFGQRISAINRTPLATRRPGEGAYGDD